MDLRTYKADPRYYWAPWQVSCYAATNDDETRGMLFDWCYSQKFGWEFRNGIFGFDCEESMLLFVMAWR
jgi:hypothetical protein